MKPTKNKDLQFNQELGKANVMDNETMEAISEQLAKTLMSKYDANSDGKLSK